MRSQKLKDWRVRLHVPPKAYPLSGHIELTYRCNLKCGHCYCRGLEDQDQELSTAQFKSLFDGLQQEGCLGLTLSGGDPLVRPDFLELYTYARDKGFMVSVFTNGLGITPEIIRQFKKRPPQAIEITLNGLTAGTYDRVVGVKGRLETVLKNIKSLVKNGVFVRVKVNYLKENVHEIAAIEKWAQKTLGTKGQFTFDPFIYPRLNGDTSSLKHRLDPDDVLKVLGRDKVELQALEERVFAKLPASQKDSLLFRCSACLKQFFISPYGQLRFCVCLRDQSVDLQAISFHEGFYGHLTKAFNEKFRTQSRCRDCSLKFVCMNCPAKAFLETGSKEAPVDYYCAIAKGIAQKVLPGAVKALKKGK